MLRATIEREEDVHDLAMSLIQQAERCITIGLVEQAIAVLTQAWTIAHPIEPHVADQAAWNIAWLSARANAPAEAAAWFARIDAPPSIDNHWSEIRAALVHTYRARSEQAAPQPEHAVQDRQSALPPLQIATLGRFEVVRDGVRLPPCSARKATTILRYLLTRRYRSATKEELMELLWPEATPIKAAHNLQVAINALRRFLDPQTMSYIQWSAGSYRLDAHASIDNDSHTFQQICDQAEQAWLTDRTEAACKLYSEAVARYTGDYYVDDSDAVWAITEREQLLTRYLVALERLGDILHAQGDHEAAINVYRRIVERDAYREDVYCNIMRCYAALGRRGDALAQYQRIAATLYTELGLDPEPATRLLYESIANPEKA